MKARGIMVYDFFEQEWRIWIGQQKYYMEPGSYFELRIKDKYFPAILQKDTDWFISLKYEVSFTPSILSLQSENLEGRLLFGS